MDYGRNVISCWRTRLAHRDVGGGRETSSSVPGAGFPENKRASGGAKVMLGGAGRP